MPKEGGTRMPIDASYTWGQQGIEAQFGPVFQPGNGVFSPGYPLARISQRGRCIGLLNLRKSCCDSGLSQDQGKPDADRV